MNPQTAAVGGRRTPPGCWCCGSPEHADRLVRLGNHPEVTVCIRCARSLAKQAWELEDRRTATPAARARNALRSVRKTVVRRGWHRHRYLGRVIRWLGRRTP